MPKCSRKCKRQNHEIFDVIIVGLGNAGCVLANRLTEDSKLKVLVLEAGRDDTRLPPLLPEDFPDPIPNKHTNQWSTLARGATSTVIDLYRSGFDSWKYVPLLRDTPDSRSIWYPKASTWGGCTEHNFTIAIRGNPQIYDEWDALLGNPDLWNYNSVLPFFKKFENRSQHKPSFVGGGEYFDPAVPIGRLGDFDPRYESKEGPIYLTHGYYEDPVATALYASCTKFLGLPTRVDFDIPGFELGLTAQSNTSFDQFGLDFPRINPYPEPYTFPNSPKYQAIGLAGSPVLLERSMAASGYIYPIQNRPNLTIRSESLVTKILINKNKRAVGVEYLEGWNIFSTGRAINTQDAGLGGTPGEARANAERSKRKIGYKRVFARYDVILCGGVYNSPHLLMLSGIGPSDHLNQFGIKVVQDLPGVGQNLMDHPEVFMTWRFKQPNNPFLYAENGINNQFLSVMTINFKSDPDHTIPNFHAHIYPGGIYGVADLPEANIGGTPGLPVSPLIPAPGNTRFKSGQPQYMFQEPTQYFQPAASIALHGTLIVEEIADIKARGFVKLKSADPTEAPLIVTNYLDNQDDINSHVNAFKNVIIPFIQGLADPATHFVEGNPNGPPFKTVPGGAGYFDDWVLPSRDQFETNGQFDSAKYTQYLLDNVWGHHTCGTCKMGQETDSMAVVDAMGRVFGIRNLRVCDASIIPIIPNANISAAVYMIGERMIEFIRADIDQKRHNP